MKLSELKTGEKGIITRVTGHGSFRKRVIELGFVNGKTVRVVRNAPLKDPVEYEVMGSQVALQRAQAAMIEVSVNMRTSVSQKMKMPLLTNTELLQKKRCRKLQQDWKRLSPSPL